jgi:hypothetical protein
MIQAMRSEVGRMRSLVFLMISLLVPYGASAQPAFRTSTPDQIKLSGLEVGFRVDEYFSEVYTEQSRVGPVFFSREPIFFRLVITNVGSTDTALVLPTMDAQQLFQVQGFAAPPLPFEGPERRWSGNKYEDEREIDVPIVFSSPAKAWAGGRFDIALERETPLNAFEGVELVMSVPSANLEPGLYRFLVKGACQEFCV